MKGKFGEHIRWRRCPLGDPCVSVINPYSGEKESNFYYIDLESVSQGKLLSEIMINKKDAPSRAQRIIQCEDILFQLVRPYQKNNYFFNKKSRQQYVASTGYAIIRSKQIPKYLYYYLHTSDFVSIVESHCTGSNYPAINSKDLASIPVCFPEDQNDQQHIADILTSCDEVIEQTEKVIAKYRDIKAGMLQDLFTCGVDANGKLRTKPEDAPELYKDSPFGKIPKEWEIKTIGEMFVFKNGLNKGKEFFGSGVPIVNYMDVYKHDKITPQMLQGRVSLSPQEIQNFTVCSGDVFFTRTSETPEEVGLSSVIIGFCKDIVFSGFVLRAHPTTDDLQDCYKQYCFRNSNLRKRIVADCTYTTRALTNGTKLSKYFLAIPPSIEQRAIADRLNTLDRKILTEEQTLAKYRSIKLGLMKRLLTPPEGALEA